MLKAHFNHTLIYKFYNSSILFSINIECRRRQHLRGNSLDIFICVRGANFKHYLQNAQQQKMFAISMEYMHT